MRIIDSLYNFELLPQPNELHLVLATDLPPRALITSALGLAFLDDRLLLTNLRQRGWDLPGGHVDDGESPEEAMRREVYEETGAHLGAVGLVGYQWIRIRAPKPPGYRYPHPDSYQVFYWARIAALDDLAPTDEALARGLFVPAEATAVPWVRRHRHGANLQFLDSPP